MTRLSEKTIDKIVNGPTRRCIHGRTERQTCAKCSSPLEVIALAVARAENGEVPKRQDRQLAKRILKELEADEWRLSRG